MKIRLTAFILAMITLTSLLFACKGPDGTEGGNTLSPQESASGEITDADVTTDAVTEENKDNRVKLTDDDGKLLYTTIKYPAEPSESLLEAVKKLRDKINSVTGYLPRTTATYTSGKITPANDACEIIIGDLPVEECRELADTVVLGDYHIAIVGKKIVVSAYSENELIRAINYISNTMLKEKDANGDPLCEIYEYNFVNARILTSVTVNDVDITKFSIVYGTKGSDDEFNLEAASKLCGYISRALGVRLPVIKDTDKCDSEYKLYVGTAFSKLDSGVTAPSPDIMNYECKSDGKSFFIVGGGGYSLRSLVNELIAKYLSKRTDDGTVNITEQSGSYLRVTDAPRASGTELRVMTYNILAAHWTEYMDVSLRYEPFKSVIDVYDPDIVGLQEVCAKWLKLITNGLSDKYGIIHPQTPDGLFPNFSPIIYKKDRFEVVKQGLEYLTPQGPNYIRLVNWAIFKDKQTGKLLVFFNTHWDPTSGPHGSDNAKIVNKVLADNPDVKYAFSTGDYNAKPDTKEYTAFMTQTGLLNASDVAKAAGTLKNDAGGCATVGTIKENITTHGPIDHVIITESVGVLSFETILWNKVEQVSDHAPKYADVVLN